MGVAAFQEQSSWFSFHLHIVATDVSTLSSFEDKNWLQVHMKKLKNKFVYPARTLETNII